MGNFPKSLFVFFSILAVSLPDKLVNVGLNCQTLNGFISSIKQQCGNADHALPSEDAEDFEDNLFSPPHPIEPIDYEKIENFIAAAVRTTTGVLEPKFDRLNERIDKMIRRYDDTMIRRFHGPFRAYHRRDRDVRYRGKRFRLSESLHLREDINLSRAKQMCRNIGWKLANIYSMEHYQSIVTYLRNNIVGRNFASVWLGMTWDQQNVHLSNGTIAPTLPWYPDFPKPGLSRNKMDIVVRSNLNDRNQGMVNFPPSHYRTGALCEL